MNTTMCSTSLIDPVRRDAGMASALRIDSGNTVSAAAAPAEVATVCKKRRRLFNVIFDSPRGVMIVAAMPSWSKDSIRTGFFIHWRALLAASLGSVRRGVKDGGDLLHISRKAGLSGRNGAARGLAVRRCSQHKRLDGAGWQRCIRRSLSSTDARLIVWSAGGKRQRCQCQYRGSSHDVSACGGYAQTFPLHHGRQSEDASRKFCEISGKSR